MCCAGCCAGSIRSAKLLGIDGRPIVGDLMATVRDAMGPSYPELVSDFARISRIAVAEETAFNRTLASGSQAVRGRGRRHQSVRRHGGFRLGRLHPARHLWFPDRAHPRNGRRSRPERRQDRLPRTDVAATPAGQGRCRRAQTRPRRPDRIPRAGRRRPHRVHRIRRINLRGKDSRHLRRRQAGSGGARTAMLSSRIEWNWCWTAPRSTPSRAVSSPTPAPSAEPEPARAPGRRSPTCRRSPKPFGCTGLTWNPGNSSRATPSSRRWTRNGAAAPRRATPAPTWCTPRCDKCWGPTRFRPDR